MCMCVCVYTYIYIHIYDRQLDQANQKNKSKMDGKIRNSILLSLACSTSAYNQNDIKDIKTTRTRKMLTSKLYDINYSFLLKPF